MHPDFVDPYFDVGGAGWFRFHAAHRRDELRERIATRKAEWRDTLDRVLENTALQIIDENVELHKIEQVTGIPMPQARDELKQEITTLDLFHSGKTPSNPNLKGHNNV